MIKETHSFYKAGAFSPPERGIMAEEILQFKKSDFIKAHAEGCTETKKVLENLAPEVFKVKYPCFKRYNNKASNAHGLVVLFEKQNCGRVVVPSPTDELGKYSTDWSEWNFVPIKGVKEID